MIDLIQIVPPVGEPVALDDVLRDLGYGDSTTIDSDTYTMLSGRISPLISATRSQCEGYLRRALLTQTWLAKYDGFPGQSGRYQHHGYPTIVLPKPPFQRISFFRYVDVGGSVQDLNPDTTYGTNPASQYGYQLDPGGETQPARLMPPFARPWPPVRRVPSNVMVQFVCGYGGLVTVSIAEGQTALTGATFGQSDIGRPISIPSAGNAQGTAALATTIASVDLSGNGATSGAALKTVANAAAYLGKPVPPDVLMGIRFLVAWYYRNDDLAASVPIEQTPGASFLDGYVNRIS